MILLVAWVVLPLLLAMLAVGCGLLVEKATRLPLSGPLLPLVGIATIVVVAQFLTLLDATAELTTPIVAGIAIVGFGWGVVPRGRRLEPWALAAAIGVFAVYAAPIVLSGEATFAGYIRLDDTATWMALTDQAMERGRDLDALAPSTYEATLAFNIGDGYPIGVFLPLGIATEILGTDVAWLVQPYMAFLAVLLVLALWELARSVVPQARLRAAVVFIGAQSALLVGYYLWGGIKEMAAAALIAATAALAVVALRERLATAALLPLALACAALIGVLSVGGAIWLVPALLAALAFAAGALGSRGALARSLLFLGIVVVLCLPVLIPGGLLPPTSSPLTSETAQGNLLGPLNKLQVFGIWPAGDFRVDPADTAATYVLIAVVAGSALYGLRAAVRSRSLVVPVYVGGAVLSSFLIVAVGSPWVEAKALATASPALLFAAAVGGAALVGRGRKAEGAVVLLALAGGVLWSNALAYRDVNLAPRDQLAELEEIGEEIAGEGPTLMTEYQPYGARHFLRAAVPEGASELRRSRVPLRDGTLLDKGDYADTDELMLEGLNAYRTLVLRRSPVQSRPPAPYELIWRGEFYEAWQRPDGAVRAVLEHLGLGSVADPAGSPRCAQVLALAEELQDGGALVAVPREPVFYLPLEATRYPSSWRSAEDASSPIPDGPGTLEAHVDLPEAGEYEVWLGGSVRTEAELRVDGRRVDSVRHHLNNEAQYIGLGSAVLEPGVHEISVLLEDTDLHPGSGHSRPEPIGPLVLSTQESAETQVRQFAPSEARELCRGRWDWIAAVA